MSESPASPVPGPPPPLAAQRRTLIVAAVAGSIVAAVATFAGRFFAGYARAPDGDSLTEMSPQEAAIAAAIADTLLPSGGMLEPGALDVGIVAFLDTYMAKADKVTRQGLRGMLYAIEHLTPVFGGGVRRFTNLSAERRLAYLQGWQDAGGMRSTAFSLLKLAIMMGYYSRPEIQSAIGVFTICPPGVSETFPIDVRALAARSFGEAAPPAAQGAQ